MKSTVLILFSLIILFLLFPSSNLINAAPAEPFYPLSSSVLNLNSTNFGSTVAKDGIVFVEFYSPRAGKCRELRDDWIK